MLGLEPTSKLRRWRLLCGLLLHIVAAANVSCVVCTWMYHCMNVDVDHGVHCRCNSEIEAQFSSPNGFDVVI